MPDLHALDPTMLLVVTTVLVLVQTAVIPGLLVPAGKAAVLAGVLAGVGELHPAATYVALAGAATVGATINYLLGRRYGVALLEHRLLARHAARIERARDLVVRRAGFSLLVGRSVAVLRATTPALAGAVGVPVRRFLFFNVLGALIWAGVYVGAGYAGGRLLPDVDRSVLLIAVAVLLSVVLLGVLVRARRLSAIRTGVGDVGQTQPCE